LALDTSATQGTGDTNGPPSGSSESLAWSTATDGVTIGSGSAAVGATGDVNPDTFHGTITQPVSYADGAGSYHVTLTYAASASV
jgi:hypothetical protein